MGVVAGNPSGTLIFDKGISEMAKHPETACNPPCAITEINAGNHKYKINLKDPELNPWVVAYCATYGLRKALQDHVSGKDQELTILHRTMTGQEVYVKGKLVAKDGSMDKAWKRWIQFLGVTPEKVSKMTTEEYVGEIIEQMKQEKFDKIAAGSMQPEEERRRISKEDKPLMDIATFTIKTQFESEGKSTSDKDFDDAVKAFFDDNKEYLREEHEAQKEAARRLQARIEAAKAKKEKEAA